MKIHELGADASVPQEVEALAVASFDLDGDDAARLPAMVWSDSSGNARIRLLAQEGEQTVGVAVGGLAGTTAFLDLLAVAPEFRLRGIGGELIRRWESRVAALGAETFAIGGNSDSYAWPGVDIRYTPAVATFIRAGYSRRDVFFHMDVDLAQVQSPSEVELRRLDEAGVTVRRGTIEDADVLARHTAREWSEAWSRETQTALRRTPPSIFLAFADGELIGFAAQGITRPTHFGPLGTVSKRRRIGIGGILTRLALADMASQGKQFGEIAWTAVDAIPFYSRTVGARLGRTFWTMTRTPDASS